MKTDLFQSCGHCWVFQICWHIECITLTALPFRIWNSSTGIPSPPLVVFIVLLSKAYLTSHSRMSGCRWAIRALRLSGSWRSFVYSSVYSCHLFLISLLLLGPFLSFIVPLFAWKVPFVSLIFLKRSLVFPILLFSSFNSVVVKLKSRLCVPSHYAELRKEDQREVWFIIALWVEEGPGTVCVLFLILVAVLRLMNPSAVR